MNKALDFLDDALAAMPLLRKRQLWKVAHFIQLAKNEVADLLQENYRLNQRLIQCYRRGAEDETTMALAADTDTHNQ